MRQVAILAVVAATLAATTSADAHVGHCTNPPKTVSSGSGLTLTQVATIGQLTNMATVPGDSPDRLYVTERAGRVDVVENGQVRPFLDLSSEIQPTIEVYNNERGMQSVAFAPDYRTSRRLYVFYSDANGDSRVDEFRATPDFQSADMSTRRHILFVEHSFTPAHYGGQLRFRGKRLLISLGEAQRPHYAQENPLYGRIVSMNPAHPKRSRHLVAKGLRNPFHFSFDPFTHALIVGDVGQDTDEEVDVIPPRLIGKANLGWPYLEGNRRLRPGNPKHYVKPAFTYNHHVGTAVMGGYVIRDPRLPQLKGRYLFGDFCDAWLAIGRIHRRHPTWAKTGIVTYAPTTFGEDTAHRLYVAASSGELYRIDPAVPSSASGL
jgi:glucose/arabinose dehydrogenase